MEQAALHGEDGGGRSRRYADLRVGVLEVVIRGLRGDAEHTGDLLGLQPSGNEHEHLDLSIREPRGTRLPTNRLAGRGQDRRH